MAGETGGGIFSVRQPSAPPMEEFDLIVLGGGTGNIVAAEAADAGLDVALVEEGPLGGTCLNRGCNPSKQLIHRADIVETVRGAPSRGIEATVEDVDFAGITEEVNGMMADAAAEKAENAREHDDVTFYQRTGRFVDERTVEVGPGGSESGDGDEEGADTERITAERVVLAGGSRPMVPDSIDGTDEVEYLTSDEALSLDERPDHLVVVGGGYIAAELGHFYEGMGADVTVVGSALTLLEREDEVIAERFTEAVSDRLDLHLGYRATALEPTDEGGVTVSAESEDGDELSVTGDEVLLATGRRPNSDRWNVEAAGLDTDDNGFVETDDYLETSVTGVWAIGDIAGNYMFKHSGDKEAEYAIANAVHGEHRAVEYPGMAHAVFASPQVASCGRTESELDEAGQDYEVGTTEFTDTAMGTALDAEDGLVKILVGPDRGVLGCHVVGPQASTLIHEVTTAVSAGADADHFAEAIHVHPALSEVLQQAFADAGGPSVSGF